MDEVESDPNLLSSSVDRLIEDMARVKDGDFSFQVQVPEQDGRTQQLAALINVVLGEVERADDRTLQAQKRLAAAIAHELNTPLGVVKSTSETLSGVASKLTSRSQEAEPADLHTEVGRLCGSITQASERMEQVVARMERFTNLGGAVVQAVDLNELLSDVIAIAAAQLSGNPEVKLDLKASPLITCRPAQLSAVFASLVDNAIEATGSEREGFVGVSSVANDSGVEVRVEDNGPGLTADQLASIFEPRFQVNADRVLTDWSLFSARRVVHQHDGQIKVDSPKGRGTAVTVTLPLRNALEKTLDQR